MKFWSNRKFIFENLKTGPNLVYDRHLVEGFMAEKWSTRIDDVYKHRFLKHLHLFIWRAIYK